MPDHSSVLSFALTISVRFLSYHSKHFSLNKKGFLTKMIFVVFEVETTIQPCWLNCLNIWFENSRTNVCEFFNKLWDSETTFRVFVLFKESYSVTELIARPKKSISCTGVTTDFFHFMTNPRCCRRKIVVS